MSPVEDAVPVIELEDIVVVVGAVDFAGEKSDALVFQMKCIRAPRLIEQMGPNIFPDASIDALRARIRIGRKIRREVLNGAHENVTLTVLEDGIGETTGELYPDRERLHNSLPFAARPPPWRVGFPGGRIRDPGDPQ